MNQSNKIIFNRADYRDVEEFYHALFQQIRALLETKQIFSFHENPKVKGMYVLQFGPGEITDETTFPVWLDGEEIASLNAYNQLRDYQNAKEYISNFEKSMEDAKNMISSFDDIDDTFGYSSIKSKKKKKKDDKDGSGGGFDA